MPQFNVLKESQSFRARAKRLEEEQRKQRSTSPFSGTPLRPQADGSMLVDAPLIVEGPLDVHGNTTIDGGLDITGPFTLPPNSVENDWLTNPIQTAQGHDDAENFALSTAWTYPLSVVIPIPAGFTKALVQGIVGVAANNSTAGVDYLFGDIAVPAYGGALPGFTIGSGLINAGAGGICWQATSVQLSGLSGPSFTVQGAVSTQNAAWAADTNNVANLDVTVTFTR